MRQRRDKASKRFAGRVTLQHCCRSAQRAAARRIGTLAAALLWTQFLALGGLARADEPDQSLVLPEYRLDTLRPASARAPALPGIASLGGGQEFRFSLPASFGFDSLGGVSLEDLGSPLDRPRATYRYTWFSRPGWDVKIGLSTTLDQDSSWQRFIGSTADRLRVGTLPTMHFSGESRLADRWLLSVNAEGLRTARGQGLDMDLRVDYSLNRDVGLFGSYRLTDSSGDLTEMSGFVPSNSAQFGVRLRF